MIDLEIAPNLETYKELLNKFKSLDIVTKELTLFGVGARGHFENPTTELLSFFLDSGKSHGLGNCFFNGLQEVITSKGFSKGLGALTSVETEVSTAKGNRIDLLIETEDALIIVECKIYHWQNNPFDDYTSYGEQRIESSKRSDEKKKELVQLVLCLDGNISNSLKMAGWHGISYQDLVKGIEPELAKVLLDNPYNKWGLFAREFLLHLKELDNMGDINENEVSFLNENFKEFTKLSAYIYQDLMPKIGAKIATDLNNSGLQDFFCKEKYSKWNYYEPIIKFTNIHWKTQSYIVLCIANREKSISHHLNLRIDKQSNELVAKFINLFGVGFSISYKKNSRESSDTIWDISWEFKNFEIEEVSKNIVELMKCLNELELNHRPLVLK